MLGVTLMPWGHSVSSVVSVKLEASGLAPRIERKRQRDHVRSEVYG